MVEEIKVTFQDKVRNAMRNRTAGGGTTKKSAEKALYKDRARLTEDIFNRETDIAELKHKGIGLDKDAKIANMNEIKQKKHLLNIDKRALKYTNKSIKGMDETVALKSQLTAQARSDLISMGKNPNEYNKLIKKSVNKQLAAAKKMRAAGKPIDKKALRMQKSITGQMREQQLISRHQQGATTRNAMNYLSIMFIGQALTKVFKGLYSSATAAFAELTKGTTDASKGITMLQANIKYVQFSLGAAISDALIPYMDTIASWAEWLSDFISKNPKTLMWIIFGGIAVGTIASIVGQVALLAGSISNLATNRAAMKAVSLMINDINGADAAKMSLMTKLIRGISGLVIAGVTVAIVIHMLEGQSDFRDRLFSTLTSVVGFAIAGAMIGSIFPGVGTALGAIIGATVGFIVGVSINTVDYAKDTGMTGADFKQAIFNIFKKRTTGLGVLEWSRDIMTLGVSFVVDAYVEAGKIAKGRGEDFATSLEGQQKLVQAYDVIQQLRVERANELGQADYNNIGIDKTLRQRISDALGNMQADNSSSMLDMMGFGNKINKKEVDDLMSQIHYIEGLSIFQDRQKQNEEALIAGTEAGTQLAAGYTDAIAAIPETITDISQDALDTLNDSLSDSNELIDKQTDYLKTQSENAAQAAKDIESLARAQERYNRALDKKENNKKSYFTADDTDAGMSSIYDF